MRIAAHLDWPRLLSATKSQDAPNTHRDAQAGLGPVPGVAGAHLASGEPRVCVAMLRFAPGAAAGKLRHSIFSPHASRSSGRSPASSLTAVSLTPRRTWTALSKRNCIDAWRFLGRQPLELAMARRAQSLSGNSARRNTCDWPRGTCWRPAASIRPAPAAQKSANAVPHSRSGAHSSICGCPNVTACVRVATR